MEIIKKLSLGVMLAALTPFYSVGQDTGNFTQFFLNPALLNPSFTGSDGKVAQYGAFRKQWAGVEGSPTISNFSLQAALPSRLNLGFNAANDKNGLISTSAASITGGYTLPITPTNFIRFGISVGAAFNKVDINALKFNSGNDAVMGTLLAKNMQVIGNFGASFHSSTFHFGVSVPNIFQPVYLSSESFAVTKINPFSTIIAHASNRFYFNKDKNVFEPYLIYRYRQNLPGQMEAAAVLHLQNMLWVGGSYKQDFGISALAGFKLKGQMAIGYSYSLKNTGANQMSSPSHEVQLGLLLGARHKSIPVYSFVNTDKDKKTAKEIQAAKKAHDVAKAKALEKQRALDKQKREAIAKKAVNNAKKDPVVVAKKDPVKTDPVVTKKDPEPVKKDPVVVAKKDPEPEKKDPVVKQPEHSGGPRLKQKIDLMGSEPDNTTTNTTQTTSTTTTPTNTTTATTGNRVSTGAVEHHENDEKDKISRLTEHAEDPDAHHGLENEAHPHAERHEFVKRGNHVDEMEIGDYIVAGVFKSKENAKHFSDGLVQLGFSISDFGYLTEKNLWYVYLGETDDIDMARRERDKYRKMKMFKDCWLLTVHH